VKHGSLKDIQMDDIADFKLTDDAMTHMGLSDADKLAIYTIIAGVLHLGNVSFEESHDDSTGLNKLLLLILFENGMCLVAIFVYFNIYHLYIVTFYR